MYFVDVAYCRAVGCVFEIRYLLFELATYFSLCEYFFRFCFSENAPVSAETVSLFSGRRKDRDCRTVSLMGNLLIIFSVISM